MAYYFKLPDLGEGIAEAEIVRWHVEPGEWVHEGDPLLDVETEKATVEIPSPATGKIESLAEEEGARVPVGGLLVLIDSGAEASSPPADPASERAKRKGRVQVAPSARKLARELGVDLNSIGSPGEARPITEADVRARAGAQAPPGDRQIPIRGARGRLVRHLSRVQQEVPAVTVVDECDFTMLEETLVGFERTAFVLKAVATALKDVPELNASFNHGEITIHERHDIGLAIQAAAALVVPVIEDVGGRSLIAIAEEVRRVTDGVRHDTLAPAELRGSTFTVTDGGGFGGLFATPLINAPEVGILGLHRVDERPVVRGGVITVRRMANISCTFDHRAVDGFDAGILLRRFIELVEAPGALPSADEESVNAESPGGAPDLQSRLIAVTESERPRIVLELVRHHADALVRAGGQVDPETDFKDLGFDSRMAVELRNRLSAATGLQLPATLAFDFPTPSKLADHLLAEIADDPDLIRDA